MVLQRTAMVNDKKNFVDGLHFQWRTTVSTFGHNGEAFWEQEQLMG